MTIAALLLYGSRARGDHDDDSDVDLLAIGASHHGGRPAGAIPVYPLDHVLRRARSGDLFALHLVAEGRVVFEREPVFVKLQRAFCFRADYGPVIRQASDVGWFLVHHRDEVADEVRFNQRMAWCAHTMIAARAANERRPLFAARALARYAGSDAVSAVIGAKRDGTVDPTVVGRFREVLAAFGGPEPVALPSLAAERDRFEVARNPAGRVAIRAMLHPPRTPREVTP